MKVLITIPRLDLPGGVASYFNTLQKVLGDDKTYLEVGRTHDENGIGSALRRLSLDYMEFWRELHREHYELVHINPSLLSGSFFRDGLLLILAKLQRKPVLVMFHGWDKAFELTIEHYLLWLFRLVYRHAAAFVVLANDFRDTLMRWTCTQPIFVETTVVDGAAMQYRREVLSANRRASLAFNVLFLARLEKAKGIYEAIDAFAILKQAVPHAQLFIAGDGPDKLSAQDYVKSRRIADVVFMGFVEGREKEEVFLRSHVYLFPSYGEGMPISVLEAMAFGLPVITRPVGGLRDFFEDGRMGFLTESLDPQVFSALIEKLAIHIQEREMMGEYNRRYAESRFAASRVAARVENIYVSVLTGRGVNQTDLSIGQSHHI